MLKLVRVTGGNHGSVVHMVSTSVVLAGFCDFRHVQLRVMKMKLDLLLIWFDAKFFGFHKGFRKSKKSISILDLRFYIKIKKSKSSLFQTIILQSTHKMIHEREKNHSTSPSP
jgi:hypothetical protein